MPKKPTSKRNFHIAGIGASAGGLEAIETFFRHTPADSGIAYVLVQHLDPTQKGFLTELVRRMTQMKVIQVTDGTNVLPNHVYVIPPNKDMAILRGTLYLTEPAERRGLRLPIDHFFRHLADDCQEKSIGIILSGMGTDGTLGIKAIKEKMGMTIAQNPAEAKYGDMPRSAIATGLTDMILSAEEMPSKLIAYLKHAASPSIAKIPLQGKSINALEKICVLIRSFTGYDFSFYKRNMIYRRIERRMSIHQIERIDLYIRYVQENATELELLFKDLLIGVTGFFRDPEAFEILKETAIRTILTNKSRGSIARIWIPGCSTGEEAYSVAILCREILDEIWLKTRVKVQIFATDIDKNAIEKARLGVYPANIATDVTTERLNRFFGKENDVYRISKEIREMVVFAPQNVFMDPPFTKLDLLSCRNLLIYLTTELQKKIIPLFHYSLLPGGFLFLGHSESVGVFGDLFAPSDIRWKIYVRRDSLIAQTNIPDFPSSYAFMDTDGVPQTGTTRVGTANIQTLAEKLILRTLTPPAVLINDRGTILYISGRTGKYLEPASGKADMNIFAMAREGLRYELESAVQSAFSHNETIVLREVNVRTNGSEQLVNLRVIPVRESEPLKGYLLVVFEDVEKPKLIRRSRKSDTSQPNFFQQRVAELENELQRTKECLQSVSEEMRSSQEELRSTNEEMQSTNEELQSTNEELTTSREELQSMNEELMSVNAEFQGKIEELTHVNNDMKNLMNSTDLATIFLDNDLHIRRFTAKATQIFALIRTDIGRPITDITSDLYYDEMADDAREVLETLVFKQSDIRTKNDLYYTVRIMPYRTIDNVIEGVVITFTDITKYKQREKDLEERISACSRNPGLLES